MHEPSTAHPVQARASTHDEVHDLLLTGLAEARWFPAKGAAGTVEPHAAIDLVDPRGEARVEVRLLRLPTGTLLQVPLTFRAPGPAGGAQELGGLLGTVDGLEVRDGCHDPAFVRAWLGAARAAGSTASEVPEADEDGTTTMRVLTGEQSNTSVLLTDASPPAILKVFRGLTTGPSADVEVPLALSGIGWQGVPRPLAWLAGSWPSLGPVTDRPDAQTSEVGHLGVLSALVVGAEDGFELACHHARTGLAFDDLAHDLGRTTAQMHHALRTALPLDPGATSTAQVVRVLRERAGAAFDAVPDLAPHRPDVEAVHQALETLSDLPPLQRVHGDYHLGQVLHSSAGWSVLDFEGEPQASTAERTRPDLALRDLAGMLRSLDYAAAVGRAEDPTWVRAAREALVAGYAEEGVTDGGSDSTLLLRALELDKALYEAVYEARNRPTWLAIPLTAVERLVRTPQA